MLFHSWLVGFWCGAAFVLLATSSIAAAAPGGAMVYELTLADAMGDGRPLTLHLPVENGRTGAGLAFAPGFNRAAHRIEAHELQREGDRLHGRLTVHLRSDGFLPKAEDPQKMILNLDVTLRNDDFTGGYTGESADTAIRGSASGRAVSVTAPRGLQSLHLTLHTVPIEGAKLWQRRAEVTLLMNDGKAIGGLMGTTGSPTYAEWTGVIESAEMSLADGRLKGGFTADVRLPAGENQRMQFAIDELLVGAVAGGSYRVSLGDQKSVEGNFAARLTTAEVPDSPEADLLLELHGALPEGHLLRLHLAHRDGRFLPGFGFSATWNRGVHEVDASRLRLAGDRLTGELQVTVHADPFKPADGKSVSARYQIDARLNRAMAVGRHEGSVGETKVQGRVAAALTPPQPMPEPARVWLKLEDGLIGGAAWVNRAFASFRLADGKAEEGSFLTNKRVWEGQLKSAQMTFGDVRVHGVLEARVDSGRASAGDYRFTMEGVRIGSFLAGRFVTYFNGREVKTGSFLGSVGDGDRSPIPLE